MAQSRRHQRCAALNVPFDGSSSSCTIKQAAPVQYAAERHGDTKLCFAHFMFRLKKYKRQKLLGCLYGGHVLLCGDSGGQSCLAVCTAVMCRCVVTVGGKVSEIAWKK